MKKLSDAKKILRSCNCFKHRNEKEKEARGGEKDKEKDARVAKLNSK